MGIGKCLVIVGLAANLAGTICLGWLVPRGSTLHMGQPTPVPFRPSAIAAQKVGWPLLMAGFALELAGTVLWT